MARFHGDGSAQCFREICRPGEKLREEMPALTSCLQTARLQWPSQNPAAIVPQHPGSAWAGAAGPPLAAERD